MARPLRIQYKGAWYHVMNRGGGRQRIFCEGKDYEVFLKLLEECVGIWGIRIHAFSLLPNHYHLLVETPRGNLSRAMRHIDGVYTQRFNRCHKRDGHLFRGRYRSILVEEEAYLVELVRYIHLNPVRAGLMRKPQEHRWTSHHVYLGRVKDCEWLTTDRLLGYFGQRLSKARRKLHEFVMAGVPEKLMMRMEGRRRLSVLSSDNFREWVERNFVEGINNREVQYAAEEGGGIKESQIRRILCEVTGEEWGGISRPKSLRQKEFRRMAIWAYRRYLGLSYGDISEHFGGLHPSYISRVISGSTTGSGWREGNVCQHLVAEIEHANVKT